MKQHYNPRSEIEPTPRLDVLLAVVIGLLLALVLFW